MSGIPLDDTDGSVRTAAASALAKPEPLPPPQSLWHAAAARTTEFGAARPIGPPKEVRLVQVKNNSVKRLKLKLVKRCCRPRIVGELRHGFVFPEYADGECRGGYDGSRGGIGKLVVRHLQIGARPRHSPSALRDL